MSLNARLVAGGGSCAPLMPGVMSHSNSFVDEFNRERLHLVAQAGDLGEVKQLLKNEKWKMIPSAVCLLHPAYCLLPTALLSFPKFQTS
jgi:hypothetical protein